MDFIADILLLAAALGAAGYCFVLSRRLNRFNDLEKGVGGAVAVLSAQVDDLSKALEGARASATASTGSLEGLTDRAENVARRLELLVAAMHDLPDTGADGTDGTGAPAGNSPEPDTVQETGPEREDPAASAGDEVNGRPVQADAPPPADDSAGALFFRHAEARQ